MFEDGGVVDQPVQRPAEPRRRLRHQARDRLLLPQIRPQDRRDTSHVADPRRDLLGRIDRSVAMHGDVMSVRRKVQRDGAADPPGRTGDKCSGHEENTFQIRMTTT